MAHEDTRFHRKRNERGIVLFTFSMHFAHLFFHIPLFSASPSLLLSRLFLINDPRTSERRNCSRELNHSQRRTLPSSRNYDERSAIGEHRSHKSDLEDLRPLISIDLTEFSDLAVTVVFSGFVLLTLAEDACNYTMDQCKSDRETCDTAYGIFSTIRTESSVSSTFRRNLSTVSRRRTSMRLVASEWCHAQCCLFHVGVRRSGSCKIPPWNTCLSLCIESNLTADGFLFSIALR